MLDKDSDSCPECVWKFALYGVDFKVSISKAQQDLLKRQEWVINAFPISLVKSMLPET